MHQVLPYNPRQKCSQGKIRILSPDTTNHPLPGHDLSLFTCISGLTGGFYSNGAISKTTLLLATQVGIIVPVITALDIICGWSSWF